MTPVMSPSVGTVRERRSHSTASITRSATLWGWRGRETATRNDDTDGDDGTVELGLVHVGNCLGGVGFVLVEDVSCAAVGTVWVGY